MKPMSNLSDEEISSAIRYLDPEFHQDESKAIQKRRAASRSRRWLAIGLGIASIGVVLYTIVLRYLPAVIRLLN